MSCGIACVGMESWTYVGENLGRLAGSVLSARRAFLLRLEQTGGVEGAGAEPCARSSLQDAHVDPQPKRTSPKQSAVHGRAVLATESRLHVLLVTESSHRPLARPRLLGLKLCSRRVSAAPPRHTQKTRSAGERQAAAAQVHAAGLWRRGLRAIPGLGVGVTLSVALQEVGVRLEELRQLPLVCEVRACGTKRP